MGAVELKVATRSDAETIWNMQKIAFSQLLDKYKDFDTNPAAEIFETITARFEQPWNTYYFIVSENKNVGAIRVVDKKDGSRKRIAPIFIMEEHRNKGYATAAINLLEQIYGSNHWCLETILQEPGNLYLYEKLGYHKTGRVDNINERMDLIFYAKN